MAKIKTSRAMSLGAFQSILAGQAGKSTDQVYDDIVSGANEPRRLPGPKRGSNICRRALTGERLYTRPR